jgi:hypothetical protein
MASAKLFFAGQILSQVSVLNLSDRTGSYHKFLIYINDGFLIGLPERSGSGHGMVVTFRTEMTAFPSRWLP